MSSRKLAKSQRTPGMIEESANLLRRLFPVGSIVTVHVSEISRSGYGARTLTVFAIDTDHDGAPYIRNVSRHVARVLDMPYTDSEGVRSHGSGMDMAYHLVYSLARVLYGDAGIADMPFNRGSSDAGYALNIRHM